MLIKFRVSNSRSIDTELEFSAIATEDDSLPQNVIDVPKYGIKLLKTMALFGANASGKSNFLKAIADAKFFIVNDKTKSDNDNDKRPVLWHYFNYNKNNAENENKPTQYSFDIFINDIYYNYTFAHNSERVVEEVLTQFPTNDSAGITIFSRIMNKEKRNDWLFYEDLQANENTDFLKKLTFVHDLFLKKATQDYDIDGFQKNAILNDIYTYFKKDFVLHTPVSGAGILTNFDNLITFLILSKSSKQFLLDIVKFADIDIKDIDFMRVAKTNKKLKNTTIYSYTNPEDSKDIDIVIRTKHFHFFL